MNHWIDWPMHPVSDAINLYYQIELGSYFHQLMWTEVNRSDALQMIAHHFITIALIVASYLTNYTRIGSTILLLHDIPDVIMELAKVLNYTSKAKGNDWLRPIVDGLFAMFMISFFITRLVIYPRHILYSVIKEGVDHFGCQHAGCYVFIGLLTSLQALHIFWFYLIARMAYRLLVVGQVEKDVRSDDEGEELLSAAGPPQLSDDEGERRISMHTVSCVMLEHPQLVV
jgi:ceramide synthetase